MHTCAEELSIEIWLMIFQYLEGHDLFQAFQNLNTYFNQILGSNYLSFYIRLRKSDNHHLPYSTNSYWSDSILNRIVCLRSAVQCPSSYMLKFLRWHAKKLIRLQSLSIKIYPRDTPLVPYICQALKELDRLKYLSLTCVPNQILIELILSIPSLCICQLILLESTMVNHPLDGNSHIKQLFVVFLNNVNYSLIKLLLFHTPKLKQLDISGSSSSMDKISILDKPLFILPELRTLKLKLEDDYFTSDCFTYLHATMPVLKHFYLRYRKRTLTETFLDFFISSWWPIIEPIQHIDIYIKGHRIIDRNGNNTQLDLKKQQQILLDKTNQSNGSFKIEWTEQDFVIFRSIEITIVKS